APPTAAEAWGSVELHGCVAQLAPEAPTPHEMAVQHDTAADAGPGGQDDERGRAAGGAEHPLAQCQRVDVVVDEYRQAAAARELRPHRQSGERGDVSHRLSDAATPRVDGTGHADPDGGPAAAHSLTHLLDQRGDRVDGP